MQFTKNTHNTSIDIDMCTMKEDVNLTNTEGILK